MFSAFRRKAGSGTEQQVRILPCMHPKVFVFLLSKGNNLIGSVRLLECIFFAASMGDQQDNFPPFVRSPQKSDTHIHAYTQMIATLAKVLVCRPNDEGSLLWASEDETKADQIRRKQLGFWKLCGKTHPDDLDCFFGTLWWTSSMWNHAPAMSEAPQEIHQTGHVSKLRISFGGCCRIKKAAATPPPPTVRA